MTKTDVRILDFFDRYNIKKIIDKYDFDENTAMRKFITSETYKMLIDKELEIYKMSPEIVFDMWDYYFRVFCDYPLDCNSYEKIM